MSPTPDAAQPPQTPLVDPVFVTADAVAELAQVLTGVDELAFANMRDGWARESVARTIMTSSWFASLTPPALEDVAAGETVHRIGSSVYSGTACTFCRSSYWACTDAVLREPHDPKASDGCCAECQDASGHEQRSLPQVAGLLAEQQADLVRRITETITAGREAFLDSPTLDPAWVAGWHSATDHHVHTLTRKENP